MGCFPFQKSFGEPGVSDGASDVSTAGTLAPFCRESPHVKGIMYHLRVGGVGIGGFMSGVFTLGGLGDGRASSLCVIAG